MRQLTANASKAVGIDIHVANILYGRSPPSAHAGLDFQRLAAGAQRPRRPGPGSTGPDGCHLL